MKKPKRKKKPEISVSDVLNAQQERFCREYLIDYNATEAATRAGYSKKTAATQGWRLLKNAKVLARVRELQAEQAERLAMTSDWVMLQLREVYQRCMQREPVMAFNPETRLMEPTGEWMFDSKGALKATELIGRQIGMFENKVNMRGDMDFNVRVDYGSPPLDPEDDEGADAV